MRTVKLVPMLLLLQSAAHADRRNPLEGQPAVRHKLELRKLRFEITPQFVTSTNQDYRFAAGPGVNVQFHITDWLGIGAQVVWTGINSNTPLENKVRAQLPNVGDAQYTGPQPTLAMHDERVLNMNFLASIYAAVTPWYGKMAVFSALFFNYDFYVMGGIGFANYTQNGCCSHFAPDPKMGDLPDPLAQHYFDASGALQNQNPAQFAGFKVGGMIGVGVHIFFNDWIGLQLELRDYITRANPGGMDVDANRILNGDDEGPQNNIFFGAGVSLMLPPKAKISK